MANRFCQHGLATGSNNGTSWENAYQSIFTAISSASSGDSVYVKEHSGIDISSGGVSFAKKLFLYGGCDASLTGTATEPRSGITILDGGLANVRGMSMTSGCVGSYIRQFRVQHTRYTGDAGAFYVDANWSSPFGVYFIDCSAIDCRGVNGGAIRAYRVSFYVCGFYAEDCVASGKGGAIYADGADLIIGAPGTTSSEVYPCAFINNSATGDGGAICGGPSNYGVFILSHSYCAGNVSGGTGGAVWTRSKIAYSRISNCLIYNNSAAQVGGVYWSVGANSGQVIFSTIVGNGATVGDVGGVHVVGSMLMDSCIVRGNLGVASNVQCNGFATGTINNSNIQDKDTTGVVPLNSIGSGCVDVDPEFNGSGDDPFDLTLDTPSSVADGGNSAVSYYSDFDKLLRVRDGIAPSMGAYERILPYIAAHYAMQGSM